MLPLDPTSTQLETARDHLADSDGVRWYARLPAARQRKVAIYLCRQVLSVLVRPEAGEAELAAWEDAHDLLMLLDDEVPDTAAHATAWNDSLSNLPDAGPADAGPARTVYHAIALMLARPTDQPLPLPAVLDVARMLGPEAAGGLASAVLQEDPAAARRDRMPSPSRLARLGVEVAIGLLHVLTCLVGARLALAAFASLDAAQLSAVVTGVVPVFRGVFDKRVRHRRITTYLLSAGVCLLVGLSPYGRLLIAYLEMFTPG